MPFGQFKGLPLRLIPNRYLEWLASRPALRPPLRGAVFAELARRRVGAEVPGLAGAPDPEVVDDLVTAGYRSLAQRHHPDAGGDGERMKAVNLAADWLRRRLAGTRR